MRVSQLAPYLEGALVLACGAALHGVGFRRFRRPKLGSHRLNPVTLRSVIGRAGAPCNGPLCRPPSNGGHAASWSGLYLQ